MSQSPSLPTDDALLERLSAYLDGELDAAESREVERLLARDEQARSQLQRLERAWSLLDQLPRAEVGGTFIQSTVEMIALSEAESISRPGASSAAVMPWLKRIGAAAAIVFAASFGYLAMQHWLDRDNRQLLGDLPVIERLDAYRQIDDVAFLRLLNESRVLEPEEASRGK
ncbi:MAG: zf-HC2 domain-containing protein [Planctomycetaceae bacterium]|nr:zf-HC2 domain-containing protein [Planctomycetaceae bacterium]